MRVALPGAVTAIALLVGAGALLSGCDGTDQQPAATTPMATAMASPSPTAGGGVDAPETAGSTRPASTPTPEPHGRDGPATTTPVPATPLPATPVPATPRSCDPRCPRPRRSCPLPIPVGGLRHRALSRGAAAPHPRDWRRTPTPEPGPVGAAGPRTVESTVSAFSAGGSVPYTWQDGEHTRRVYLQPDLVLQDPADNTSEDVVVRAGRMENVVQRTARHGEQDTLPVFRSASGSIMTLPGGVLLVFDEQWDQRRINTFVATNGIDKGSIRALDFTPNAFFIDTAPGLASLELANALAAEEGVVIASPNWRREVVLR